MSTVLSCSGGSFLYATISVDVFFFVIFLIIEDYLKVCWDYEGTPPKYRKEIRWTNPVFSCMFYKRSTMFFGLKHCLRL